MLLIYPSANIALVVRSIANIALKPTRTGKGLRESKIVYFPGASRWTPQTGEPRTFKYTHIFLLTFPSLERLPNFCAERLQDRFCTDFRSRSIFQRGRWSTSPGFSLRSNFGTRTAYYVFAGKNTHFACPLTGTLGYQSLTRKCISKNVSRFRENSPSGYDI